MDPLSSVLDQMEDDDDFDFDPPECLVPQFTAEDLPHLNTNSHNGARALDAESTSSASSEAKTKFLYPHLDTVEILRPEEIRWFYKEPGEKKWTAFIGYDSLRIECKYRELQGRKIEGIAKQQAEDDKFDGEVPLEPERICVRGSLFEVDVTKQNCCPIYWSSALETADVLRGTWYYDYSWQPLEEEVSDQVEARHLQKFEHHKLPATKTEPHKGIQPVFTKIELKDSYVEWNAIDYVSMHYHTTSSKINRAVRSTLGMAAKTGNRLQRGYCYEAKMDDKPADISHLVFVVHGIGQKMEEGSIVKSCAMLRNIATRLLSKYEAGTNDHDKKRVEFLPCEWRSSLKLDGDIVDTLTPRKIKGLRSMLNASAMDVLYYTSPLYRSEITHGLQSELNRLYSMFCARHPYFEASGGKASIVAHSLGCVIVYDIITGWNPIQLYDQYVSHVIESRCKQVESAKDMLVQLEKARKKVSELESDLLQLAEKQQLKTPTLKFRLENFFCLGSPLAVFLALRGVRPKGQGTQDHILPRSLCSRLFNLFHPSDPVAYRLEPLILKHYEGLKPLRVHRYDAPQRPQYHTMPNNAYPAAVSASAAASASDMDTQELMMHDLDILTNAIKKAERNNNVHPEKKYMDDSSRTTASYSSPLKSLSPPPTVPLVKDPGELDLSSSGSGGTSPMKKRGRKISKLLDASSLADNDGDNSGAEESWVNVCCQHSMEPTDGSAAAEELAEMDHRLDYMLKEGKMENSYVAALTSHTAYWSNSDVALFLLMQLYPDYFKATES